jgi:hypothetical protein
MQKSSQEDRILALLRSRGAAWTPAPELADISLQYCARICSLRAQGIAIENRVEIQDGVKRGFYRLTKLATPTPAVVGQLQAAPQSLPVPTSLFGDLSPEPEYPS